MKAGETRVIENKITGECHVVLCTGEDDYKHWDIVPIHIQWQKVLNDVLSCTNNTNQEDR